MHLLKNIKNSYSHILSKQHKRRAFFIFGLVMICAMFEVLSIGTIIPYINFVVDRDLGLVKAYSPYFYNLLKELSIFELNLYAFLLLVVIFGIRSGVVMYSAWFRECFIADLRVQISARLLDSYMQQEYDFFLKDNIAVFTRNVMTEAVKFSGLVNIFIIYVFDIFVVFALVIAMLWLYFFETLFLGLVFSAILSLYFPIIGKPLLRFGNIRQKSDALRLQIIRENLSVTNEVEIFGRRHQFVERYRLPNNASAEAAKIAAFLKEIPRHVFEIVAVICFGVIFLYQAMQDVAIGQIVSSLGVFGFIAIRLLPTVNRIASGFNALKFGTPVFDVVLRDLNRSACSQVGDEKRLTFSRSLEIRNLSFQYEQGGKVLDGVSFGIKKRETVGLVGESGSGKTTLLKCLLGVLDCKENFLFCDGVKVNPKSNEWRKLVGYVPQAVFLIDDTLEKNIVFEAPTDFVPKFTVDEVIDKVQLRDLVESSPNALDMWLGDNGFNISGGQRQRIGIARALYNSNEILILDEPTSSLDAETEKRFVELLTEIRRYMTVIIVSHKETSLTSCDRILCLRNGLIEDA